MNLSVLVSQPVFFGRVWRCISGFGTVFLGLYVGNPRKLLDVAFLDVVYLRKYLKFGHALWAKIARKVSLCLENETFLAIFKHYDSYLGHRRPMGTNPEVGILWCLSPANLRDLDYH